MGEGGGQAPAPQAAPTTGWQSFLTGLQEGASGLAVRTPDWGSSTPYTLGALLPMLGGATQNLRGGNPMGGLAQLYQALAPFLPQGNVTRMGPQAAPMKNPGSLVTNLIAGYTGGLLGNHGR